MKEKQLFPCDTTHLARMMLREDDGNQSYVIQSDYNKGTKTYESELIIPVGSPTAELEAWNAYLGAQDTAVNKILRERPELKAYFAELARETHRNIDLTIDDIVEDFKQKCELFRKAVQ